MVSEGNDLFSEVEHEVEDESGVLNVYRSKGADYVLRSDLMTDYGRQKLGDVLDWIQNDYRLELLNENWNDTPYKQYVPPSPSRRLQQVVERMKDSVDYYVEHDYGYEEESNERPKTEGERLGAKMFEGLKALMEPDWDEFGQDVRASEYAKSKAAANKYLYDIAFSLAQKLPALGSQRLASDYTRNTSMDTALRKYRSMR